MNPNNQQEQLSPEAARKRIAELEAQVMTLTGERDALRKSRDDLLLEIQLLRRRIFVAKAERVDTAQLELEFAEKVKELNLLSGFPQPAFDTETATVSAPRKKAKPTGRRDLSKVPLEEERVEITDPEMEKLVADGKAQKFGVEESYKLAYKRGGMRRLVVARVTYQTTDKRGDSTLLTTAMPTETFPRLMAAPSMLAQVISSKHCEGLPLYRYEDRAHRDGVALDRGTMCRWLEDAGATFGSTVVAAMKKEALATAFCIAADATGVSVQPEPLPDGKRQSCRKAHYFVMIADRDHVFFEYTPKETSAVVRELLRGYHGYLQVDAKSVYDVLFREPEPPDDTEVCTEVGCWSHARRKFWEATVAKCVVAREGLLRIGRMFECDARFKGKPPETIRQLRDKHLRPEMEVFFAWAEVEYAKVEEQRGLLRTALGYVVRQKAALMRVLEDGRLILENNRSERELRRIAIGRKAWLFVGSDDHGLSAGHLFTLIASARLHKLDPEQYLRDLIRVLGHWPKDRYLELSPKYWAATRQRLNPEELAKEVGDLTIPEPAVAVVAQA